MLALFEGVASRRGRRLRAHGRHAGGDAAAPRAGPRQRVREPPQRVQGAHADGERGRRPRACAPAARRAADHRRRGAGAAGLALVAHDAATRARPRADAALAAAAARAAAADRDAGAARRRRLGEPSPGVAAPGGAAPRAPPPEGAVEQAARAPALRRGRRRILLGRPRAARARPARRRADRRRHRRDACLRDTFPTRLERGGGRPRPRAAAVLDRARGRRAGRRSSTWCSPARSRRSRSSPIRASRACWLPDGAEVHVLAAPEEDAIGRAGGAGRRARRAGGRRRSRQPRAPGAHRPARSTVDDARRGRRRHCCPRARSSPTRRSRVGFLLVERHRRRAAARLARPHRRRDRLGPAGRHRRRGRVPRPAGDLPGGRRLGDVHDPGAVDAGARGARRDHRRSSPTAPTRSSTSSCQRVGADGDGEPRARAVRHRPARPRLRRAGARRWACPAGASRPPRSSAPRCAGVRRAGPAPDRGSKTNERRTAT